jgi:hypothetical protein
VSLTAQQEATTGTVPGAQHVDLEKLRKKRFIDAETASQMLAIGWRQVEPLEGLSYCAVCQQPTVWKDKSGAPSHLWCSNIGGDQ